MCLEGNFGILFIIIDKISYKSYLLQPTKELHYILYIIEAKDGNWTSSEIVGSDAKVYMIWAKLTAKGLNF